MLQELKTFLTNSNVILGSLVSLVTLLSVIITILVFFKRQLEKIKKESKDFLESTEFKLKIEEKVEENIKKRMEQFTYEDTLTNIDEKLDSLNSITKNLETERLATDAHLSRMITYYLNKTDKEYVWAIGWGGRTLKRYTKVYTMELSMGKEFKYHNFVEDTCNYIINAINNIITPTLKKRSNKEIIAMLKKDILTGNTLEDDKTIRMLKDIYDVKGEKICNSRSFRYIDTFRPIIRYFIILIAKALKDDKPSDDLHSEITQIAWHSEKDDLITEIEKNYEIEIDLVAMCKKIADRCNKYLEYSR